MGSTRRDFIKDATVIGAVVAAGTCLDSEKARAEITDRADPVDETTRCPYFDQPLFCKGMTTNGKFLCDE